MSCHHYRLAALASCTYYVLVSIQIQTLYITYSVASFPISLLSSSMDSNLCVCSYLLRCERPELVDKSRQECPRALDIRSGGRYLGRYCHGEYARVRSR